MDGSNACLVVVIRMTSQANGGDGKKGPVGGGGCQIGHQNQPSSPRCVYTVYGAACWLPIVYAQSWSVFSTRC